MRILTLLVAIWGLVGLPSLCRAGVLVECCVPAHHTEKESPRCPDGCPNKCPNESPDKGPDSTGSSGERDCSSCVGVCNWMSLAPQKLAAEDFETTSTPVVATTLALTGGFPSGPSGSPDVFKPRPRGNLPFPTSDLPLLI